MLEKKLSMEILIKVITLPDCPRELSVRNFSQKLQQLYVISKRFAYDALPCFSCIATKLHTQTHTEFNEIFPEDVPDL